MADPASGLGGLGGQFWSTLIGAVVGSIVSGVVSLGLQKFAAKASREAEEALRAERREGAEAASRERLLEKRQLDLSLAHSITFKLIAMLSTLAQVDDVAKESKERIGLKRDHNSWLLVTPIANKFPQQALERDEQSLVASFKISGMTGKIAECFYIYNDFLFLLESYKSQRFDVLHRIAAGRIGKMNLGSEPLPGELITYEPLIIPVRQLAEMILDRASVDFNLVRVTLERLTTECERLFGSEFGKLSDVKAHSNVI